MANSAYETAGTTYASFLTPPGRGAVATVAVHGPAASQAVASCFEPLSGRPLESYEQGSIVVGLFRSESGTTEELVVGLVGPKRIEIHCHGGRAAVQAVVRALVSAGCSERTWQEHVSAQHAGKIEAEAWTALALAITERTAGILLDQTRGALRREIENTIELLQTGNVVQVQAKVKMLLDRGRMGLHLTEPWRIVIAGQPNVGKSSLINALVGYQRSIVFDQPGTTRDVLSARTALDGWPIELIDTAGLRETSDPLELTGIGRAIAVSESADLVLLVADASTTWTVDDQLPLLKIGHKEVMIVFNKVDLSAKTDPAPDVQPAVSARTGEGLDRLLKAIASRLRLGSIKAGEAVPFTRRQLDQLAAAQDALTADDIRTALGSLHSAIAH